MSKLDDAITNSYDHESTTDGPWEIDEDKLKRNVKALMLELIEEAYTIENFFSMQDHKAELIKKVQAL
jgi:hypothetical protein